MVESPGDSGVISDMKPSDFGARCDTAGGCHSDRGGVPPPVISSGANGVSGVEKSRIASVVGDLSVPRPCGRSSRDDNSPLSFRARRSASPVISSGAKRSPPVISSGANGVSGVEKSHTVPSRDFSTTALRASGRNDNVGTLRASGRNDNVGRYTSGTNDLSICPITPRGGWWQGRRPREPCW